MINQNIVRVKKTKLQKYGKSVFYQRWPARWFEIVEGALKSAVLRLR